jgi:hypothetical protein
MKHILVAVALFAASYHVRAATALIEFTGYTGTFTDNVPRVIGWDFTTQSTPITLTGLSFFDAGVDGLNASHHVGLYDTTTQTLVASTIIPSGSAAYLTGQFRTVGISPVLLAANHTYTLAATWTASSDPWVWDGGILGVDMTGFSVSPWISSGSAPARFTAFSSTLAFPTSQINDGRNWFVGPNGIFTVPEPSRAVLILMSLFGVSMRRRRA